MKNDATSASVYDTGVVALSNPLYPVNYDGTQNELVVTVPASSGMANGNEYKWTMTSYWTNTDYFESYENVFKAYANAVLTITNLPTKITTRNYEFTAACTQAQGVGVERFGWIIRNKDTLEEAINTIDSGNIYSSDVRVSYDGFLAGTTEEVKVKCWLNDGTEIETPFYSIPVAYDLITTENRVTASLRDDSGVLVNWNKLYYIMGEVDGTGYTFPSGQFGYPGKFLRLPADEYVSWDTVTGQQMQFPPNVSHTISFYVGNPDATVGYDIYSAQDNVKTGLYISIGIENGNYVFDTPDGNMITLFPASSAQRWVTISISPNKIRYIIQSVQEALIPSDTLVPSPALYPRSIKYNYTTGMVSGFDIGEILSWNEIVINAPADYRFVWIKENDLTDEEFNRFTDINYVPTWDDETYMLAKFDGDFNAGNLSSENPVTEWMVYSIEAGSSFLKPIKTLSYTYNNLVDYTARNNENIAYYVFPVFGNKIGAAVMSNMISPNWWNWDLIICDKISENIYKQAKTYKFDLDVSSGMLTNNTKFNALDNFTRYAKIQNSNANYWSGTLTALLGNCADKYVDTVAQMDEIRNLATDSRDKFLKDRKGNFWKVRLNSPVSESMMDEYVEQAVSVSLGWAEVGDASDSVITNIDA